MKRIYTSTSIAAASLLLSATPAFAATVQVGNPFPQLADLSIGGILTFIINAAFVIAAILTLIYLIWGGINWITSGGDSEAVGAARNRIIAALIGLIIVILAYFILDFVLSELIGVGSFRDPEGLQFDSLADSN